jgi:2-C-methyl-D-erythritol 4-phosphate cytidylyltransferase
VAAPPDRVEEFSRVVGPRGKVVAGGETRSASVRLGFEALAPADEDVVAVHDAARPFLTEPEIEEVLRAGAETGAAIAATPVVDTIKRVAAGRILQTVDREGLFGAATPQAFRAGLLRRALASGRDATDEAALCEALGIPVAVVPVSRFSFKITTPEDLALAEAILAGRGR